MKVNLKQAPNFTTHQKPSFKGYDISKIDGQKMKKLVAFSNDRFHLNLDAKGIEELANSWVDFIKNMPAKIKIDKSIKVTIENTQFSEPRYLKAPFLQARIGLEDNVDERKLFWLAQKEYKTYKFNMSIKEQDSFAESIKLFADNMKILLNK